MARLVYEILYFGDEIDGEEVEGMGGWKLVYVGLNLEDAEEYLDYLLHQVDAENLDWNW